MTYNPNIHNRRSIRLKNYDYSQSGLYFITICCQDRKHIFGEIVEGEMKLNDAGKIVNNTWFDLPNHNNNIVLDEFCVMPNHIHGIIAIVSDCPNVAIPVGAGSKPAPNLNDIIDDNNDIIDNNNHIIDDNNDIIDDTNDIIDNNNHIIAPKNDVMNDKNHVVNDNRAGLNKCNDNRAGLNKCNRALNKCNRAGLEPAPTMHPLSEIVRQLKTFSAKRINVLQNTNGYKLWQRNYYEHIIRNEISYHKIAAYIKNNPSQWENDKLFSTCTYHS